MCQIKNDCCQTFIPHSLLCQLFRHYVMSSISPLRSNNAAVAPLCGSPSGEMVRQARVLAQATSDLVNAMRSDAEAEVDLDNSKKLLAAAKLLADATARMVEAAKVSHAPYYAKFTLSISICASNL